MKKARALLPYACVEDACKILGHTSIFQWAIGIGDRAEQQAAVDTMDGGYLPTKWGWREQKLQVRNSVHPVGRKSSF